MLIRPPSVTGVVDRLERAGLVVRDGSPTDLRAKQVGLTEQGRRLVERVLTLHGDQIESVLGGLSLPEQTELHRLLNRLGGHLVSGHVDGIAEIRSRRDFDGMAHFRFHVPSALARFIAPKGSVALEGTSLTVNAVEGEDFEVLLIPHTLAVTAWGGRKSQRLPAAATAR